MVFVIMFSVVPALCTDAGHSKDTINLLASLLSPGVHL